MATPKPRQTVSSYKCIRGQQDGLIRVLNENSFSMAEYNQRTGRFIWMRVLPITQREAVEDWVRGQFTPTMPGQSKVGVPKAKSAKVG